MNVTASHPNSWRPDNQRRENQELLPGAAPTFLKGRTADPFLRKNFFTFSDDSNYDTISIVPQLKDHVNTITSKFRRKFSCVRDSRHRPMTFSSFRTGRITEILFRSTGIAVLEDGPWQLHLENALFCAQPRQFCSVKPCWLKPLQVYTLK